MLMMGLQFRMAHKDTATSGRDPRAGARRRRTDGCSRYLPPGRCRKGCDLLELSKLTAVTVRGPRVPKASA